jgi:multidrug resistance efflux pump
MEHVETKHTVASVIKRYVRLRWRTPLHIIGILGLLLLVMGFMPVRAKHERRAARAADGQTTGVVESILARSVGSVFDGTVQEVKIWRGKQVKKGEVLFKMDASPYVAELDAARSEFALASRELADLRGRRAEDLASLRGEISSLQRELAAERQLASAARQPAQPLVDETGAVVAAPVMSHPVAVYDPLRASELAAQLRDARARLAEQAQSWAPVIADAAGEVSRCSARIRELKTMIAGAVRRSPSDGIVTNIVAKPGERVARKQPVVRVDDPEGYRVVTLVDEEAREPLKPGVIVPLQRKDGIAAGKLEKIVPGWDDQVFQYYLWVKPNRTDGLWPGQSIGVELPKTSQMASAG